MTHQEPPALTIADVAELLQVTQRTVRRLIFRGVITANKLGPSDQAEWRIPRSSLDAWLGPWRPPEAYGPTSAHTDDRPPEGGFSREALRARAGLPDEPGPAQTHPAPDAKSTAPTGTVAPEHPEPPRPVVHMRSITTRPAVHPSETYVPAEEKSVRQAMRMTSVAAAHGDSPSLVHGTLAYEGHEPPPRDGATFGAGPAEDDAA